MDPARVPLVDKPAAAGPAGAFDADTHARRAASFGAAAAAYARYRPDYPAAAIAWALDPVITTSGHPIRIADLGAGTGKLTAQLASLQLDSGRPTVVAVEPDPQMLAELRSSLPQVASMAGSAEAIPLPDTSVDVVLAGQAAHWFDLDRAMPEIARVLTPGGVFAGLWNVDDDRVDWVAGLHQITGRGNQISFTSTVTDDEDGLSAWLRGPGSELYRPPEASGFEHGLRRTASSVIENMRTQSMFLIMESTERETVLDAVAAYLAATPQTAAGEFTFPMWTLAQRTVLR